MKVVLFCGGLGTRIREYSESIIRSSRIDCRGTCGSSLGNTVKTEASRIDDA
jgi:hypothetical protein